MQTVRTSALIVLSALAAASLIGCGRHSRSERFYLVASNTKLAYWQSAAAGLDKAAAEYGVHAELRGPEDFDPKGEVADFRSVVALKPTGILVSVEDPVLMQPEIDAALAAGVPVITLDSDAPSSHRLFFIGTNNREAGRLGGETLKEKLNDRGNVVVFTMPGQPNLDDRLQGYNDILAGSPAIHIVAIEDIHGDPAAAFDKTQQYLAHTGKDRVDAFICLEASAGKEVGEVLRRGNVKDRIVVAMDVDKDTLNMVKSGVITATIAQKPFTMAYVGVKMLDDIYHDPLPSLTRNYEADPFAPVPAFVDTGSAVVNADNVDRFIQASQQKRTE